MTQGKKIRKILTGVIPAAAAAGCVITVLTVQDTSASATDPAAVYVQETITEEAATWQQETATKQQEAQIQTTRAKPDYVPEALKPGKEREISKEDHYLLAKMVMAEAEDETVIGQALVALVILNRVDDPNFPDTVEEVIYQDGQFSPISNGRWDAVEPDDSCYAAVHLVGTGWDESYGATYFVSKNSKSTWHENNLEYLFAEGAHKFYREYDHERSVE